MALSLPTLPSRASRHIAFSVLVLCGSPGWAQTAPAVPAPPTLAAPAKPAASSPVDKKIIEDDKVRIEETRLRGQTQNVTVHSKLPGVKSYEVIMPPLGKDPSQDKGAAGKRTWSLFDF